MRVQSDHRPEKNEGTYVDIFVGEFMSTGFLVDQLSDTDDDLISIENGHAADRMGPIAGFVVDFFVKPWIL